MFILSEIVKKKINCPILHLNTKFKFCEKAGITRNTPDNRHRFSHKVSQNVEKTVFFKFLPIAFMPGFLSPFYLLILGLKEPSSIFPSGQ